MPNPDESVPDAAAVAEALGGALEAEGRDYAFGGAIALGWVRAQIEDMYGKWDPRVSTWDELVAEVAQ